MILTRINLITRIDEFNRFRIKFQSGILKISRLIITFKFKFNDSKGTIAHSDLITQGKTNSKIIL